MKTPTAFRPPAQGCPRPAGYPGSAYFISPQPQRGCITPATKRCNPVGVENILDGRPRVVALLQPWAELLYPVGVNRTAYENINQSPEEIARVEGA